MSLTKRPLKKTISTHEQTLSKLKFLHRKIKSLDDFTKFSLDSSENSQWFSWYIVTYPKSVVLRTLIKFNIINSKYDIPYLIAKTLTAWQAQLSAKPSASLVVNAQRTNLMLFALVVQCAPIFRYAYQSETALTCFKALSNEEDEAISRFQCDDALCNSVVLDYLQENKSGPGLNADLLKTFKKSSNTSTFINFDHLVNATIFYNYDKRHINDVVKFLKGKFGPAPKGTPVDDVVGKIKTFKSPSLATSSQQVFSALKPYCSRPDSPQYTSFEEPFYSSSLSFQHRKVSFYSSLGDR